MKNHGYVIKNNVCLFQKGPLSQWWGAYAGQESSFVVGNGRGVMTEFNCCEQWMMACKADLFCDDLTFERIMNTKDPKTQKALGRSVKYFDPVMWDKIKYNTVLSGNKFKFEQNEELKEYLLTFNKHTIFAEAAPWDKIWGIGLGPEDNDSLDINKWKGENLLGEAIRATRRWLDDPNRNRGEACYIKPQPFEDEDE